MTQGIGTRHQLLQQKLISARENAALASHRQNEIAHLQEQREAEQLLHQELSTALRDEERDVEKLGKISWKWIKAKIGEGVDEALVREELEAVAAAHQVHASELELEFFDSEISRYQDELSELGDADADIEYAQKALEEFVRAELPAVAVELVKLDEQDAELHAELVELIEALNAGDDVAGKLELLRTQLRNAKNLSIMDAWGGGLLISMAKRDHLRASTDQTREIAHAMERFDRELGDTGVARVAVQLDIALGQGMFDVWFDNIFTDLGVHDKITKASEQTYEVLREVKQSLSLLHDGVEAVEFQLAALETQRLELLSRPRDAE